ncbi:hypothetical protein UFOVP153_6 [uncultured Caudovirales phage]|uniref:Lipoprotein n=1 Tax=uncultured Caudovirales phage TaxID=2100421 RepID=A0A6J5KY83_9CAUD|nr:hypothetical protein UFOVP69_52 [uncultured Caudovirales phage]CAB5170173.1 hypothetical protein UFOVP153_6 [uncultured Caudovirales phage]
MKIGYNNTNPFKPSLIALLLLIAACIVLVLNGCNPQRKIQRAEQIVITNPESFNKVGKEWGLLNPCSNDTLFKLLEDTTTHHDTTISFKTDTLKPDTVRIFSVQTVTKKIIQVITDKQKQKLDADSIQKLNIVIADLKGQIAEKDKRIKDAESKNTVWIWWFVGAICAGICSNGAWIVAKFKGII